MDGENLAGAKDHYDLIVSSMAVQWFETPLESLKRLRDLGPVYYATLGKKSFLEWKSCLENLSLADGTRDVPDWPEVIEEKTIARQYKSAAHFLNTLKEIGTASPQQNYSALSYRDLRAAMRQFDDRYQGSVSWHIVTGAIL